MINMKKIISLLMALTLVFGLATVSAGATEETITENNNYYESVKYATENGFLDADIKDVTIAQLNEVMTRAELVVMLAQMHNVDLTTKVTGEVKNGNLVFGVDKCKDLANVTDVKLYNAAAWAFENSIITGYTDGNFYPEKLITREEVAAIIYRYGTGVGAGKLDLVETDNMYFYYDADQIGPTGYSKDAIEWCLKYGIFKGDANGYFGAGETGITVANMCAVVHRTMENETAQMDTTKFYLAVESGDGYVSARVNDNYIMKVEVSAKNLKPATVKLIAEMNNVASLGVNSSKKHEVTINTGLGEDLDPSLKDWMVNTFKFDGAVINVDIAGKTCVYNVGAVEYSETTQVATIWFVPEDVAKTRAAWQALTAKENISTSTQATDDSYIVIGAGSVLQLGSEYITTEGEADVYGLKLDNFNSIEALKQTIRDGVVLKNATESAIVGKLTAGTALAVGQSVATLEKNATIEITGVPTESVDGILGDLRDATSTYAMAELLIKAIDGVVGAIDNGTEVGVNISFE